ncbi:hypothetical protein EMIT0P258_40080 [Pseudomonas sp. IT-P258]
MKRVFANLLHWGGMYIFPPLLHKRQNCRIVIWQNLDASPRYRPNGETGRRMGLKIPRS